MARKKKNKNSQTFDVYPYLDQYQYLMRSGGSLPWYQNKSDVDIEAENKRNSTNATTGTMKGQPRPTKPDPSVSPWKEMDTETFRAAYKKWLGLNGLWEMENEGVDEREEVDGSPEGGGEEPSEAERLAKMAAFRKEHNIPDGQDLTPAQVELYEKYEPTDYPIGSKEDEVVEGTDTKETVVKSEYDQAVKDYQDGKISRKELDELTQRYMIDGKRTDGYKTGNTQFETKPGSVWNLLGNALESTNKVFSQFGKNRINPKTNKPYEKSDFQKSSFDWSNLSNVNKANIYFDEENLKKFTSGEGDDLKVSDVFKTKTMNQAENFNKFQEERVKLTEEAGQKNLFSRQSMDRITGDITYDDITEDVLSKTKNPAYIEAIQNIPFNEDLEGHPSLKDIPEYLTESQTRVHTDDDLTQGDLAKEHLKDMSVTDIIFDKEGNVIKYKGFGSEGSGEGSTGTWEYDKDKKYGDWEETIEINTQEVLNNRRKGLNDDGTKKEDIEEKTEDGPKEVSRVTNADHSVTITYDDGSVKTMNEGSQEKKNREKKERENQKKGGEMELKTFIYGGQPSKEKLSFTDMYAKGGDVLKWYGAGDETENEEDLKETTDVNETPVIIEEPCPDPGTCVDPQTWNPNTCACQEDYDDEINFSAEEIALMDEENMSDTDLIESETTYGKGTQGIKNRWGAFTKTGTSGKIMNTYGNLGQSAVDWADFGVALTDTWANEATRKKAEMEGNTAADMFVTQESSQGIHDPLSGDRWTNKKVDEIYSGNTMKAPLIMTQQGGAPVAQQVPIEESLDYSALAQFEGNNAWDSEVSYSPEVIAYQKKIMGKMKNGGQLPGYQTTGEKKKVHDFLEYHSNYPRTFDVPYTGDFTETELRDAISRDSLQIENDLANSWIYRNIIGQDQTHQSNFGPAGKLQLNREWLHKLLNSDTETEADNLNFYKRGGQLPRFDNNAEVTEFTGTQSGNSWDDLSFFQKANYGFSKSLHDQNLIGGTAPVIGGVGKIKKTADVINTAVSYIPKTVSSGSALDAQINRQDIIAEQTGTTSTTGSQGVGSGQYMETDILKKGGEQEVEVDYEILQELIKAGADIEII